MTSVRGFNGHYRVFSPSRVHGGGQRPSRRDAEFNPDPRELAAWSAEVARSRAAYRVMPNTLIRSRLAR